MPPPSSTAAGIVVLLSDLLDPTADKVIRELAATGSELIVMHVLSPDELDPALEGDLRLVDSETGEGLDVTVDLATVDAYKARLAAWKADFADLAAKRRASYVDLSSDAEPRRPHVRRAAPPPGPGLTDAVHQPARAAGLLFIPAVIAMYLLKLRRDQAVVPSTLLWSRLLTDVEANAPWQRLRRSLLLLLQLLLVLALVLLAARPFLERPAGLARDIVLVMDTSASMGATDVAPNRLAAARDAAIAALKDLPTGGKVSVIAADRTRPDRRQRDDRSRPRPPGHRRPPPGTDAAATSATRSSSPRSWRRAPATRRSSSPRTRPSRRRRP